MKIAIVQDGPEYNDFDKSLKKALHYIEEASKNKCQIIVFGECWFCGYPIWLDICKDVNIWDHTPVKQLWASMYENAVDLNSGQLDQLKSALKKHDMYAVIGLNEKLEKGRNNRSLFNSVIILSPKAGLINHHRKLVPTYTEKLVHAYGDAVGLKTVKTEFGNIGALICWEHWMPMTRQAMHDCPEDIHIALWPSVKEMHHVASRHYAFEGRCFVISVGQIMHKSELPVTLELSDAAELYKGDFLMNGGSAVYGPDGSIILKADYQSRGLITTELDTSMIIAENMNMSVSGHYQRPDIFDYTINKDRKDD